jgi:hypothetical protein
VSPVAIKLLPSELLIQVCRHMSLFCHNAPTPASCPLLLLLVPYFSRNRLNNFTNICVKIKLNANLIQHLTNVIVPRLRQLISSSQDPQQRYAIFRILDQIAVANYAFEQHDYRSLDAMLQQIDNEMLRNNLGGLHTAPPTFTTMPHPSGGAIHVGGGVLQQPQQHHHLSSTSRGEPKAAPQQLQQFLTPAEQQLRFPAAQPPTHVFHPAPLLFTTTSIPQQQRPTSSSCEASSYGGGAFQFQKQQQQQHFLLHSSVAEGPSSSSNSNVQQQQELLISQLCGGIQVPSALQPVAAAVGGGGSKRKRQQLVASTSDAARVAEAKRSKKRLVIGTSMHGKLSLINY